MYIPDLAAYSSTKRALNGLTLTARAELKKDNIVVSLMHPYITASDFYKNALRDRGGEGGHARDDADLPPPDSSEYVAGKILELMDSGEPESFAHDWMGK